MNRDGDTIGTSKMVKTIAPVEQNSASQEPDIDHVPSEVTNEIPEIPDTRTDDRLMTVTNAILFVLGFACCVVVFGAARMLQGGQRKAWWRKRGEVKYEAIPLDSREQDERVSRPKVRWADE